MATPYDPNVSMPQYGSANPVATPVDFSRRSIDVNPALTFAQQQQAAGIQLGAITPQSLTPATPLTVGASPTPTPIASVDQTIATNDKNLTASATPAPVSTVDSLLAQLSANTPPPTGTPQQADMTGVNTAQSAENTARDKYNALNAQLQQYNYNASTLIPAAIQENAQAGGANVTKAGLAPIQAAELRKNALAAAPIQFQALIAQSEVASAQGKTALTQGIYKQAQDHLNAIFTAQQQDSQNMWNYRNNFIDKALTVATGEKAQALADMKVQIATNNNQYNAFVNDMNALAKSASDNGQSDVASQVAQLITTVDPNSKTYREDFVKAQSKAAALQGKIVVQKKLDTPTLKESVTNKPMTLTQVESFRRSYGWTPPLGFTQPQLEQYIADNPNATPDELEAGARQVIGKTTKESTATVPNTATPDEIVSFVTGNMNDAQKSALKKKADEAGSSAWYLPASMDIKNYLNSIKDQIQEALDAGYTKEEILAHLAS